MPTAPGRVAARRCKRRLCLPPAAEGRPARLCRGVNAVYTCALLIGQLHRAGLLSRAVHTAVTALCPGHGVAAWLECECEYDPPRDAPLRRGAARCRPAQGVAGVAGARRRAVCRPGCAHALPGAAPGSRPWRVVGTARPCGRGRRTAAAAVLVAAGWAAPVRPGRPAPGARRLRVRGRRRPADLADGLDAGLLASVWGRLGMGRAKRRAWESALPALAGNRAAVA
jgi:hypothetical protein